MNILKGLLKPINFYVNLSEIRRRIFQMSIDEIISILEEYDMTVIKLDNYNIFAVKDYETRQREYISVSDIISNSRINLAFKYLMNIKLYTEYDLRKITYGILAHKAYYQRLITIPQISIEQLVIDYNRKIIGRVDILTQDMVVELKTSNNPSTKHIIQAALYCWISVTKEYQIIYPNFVIHDYLTRETIGKLSRLYEQTKRNIEEVKKYDSIYDVMTDPNLSEEISKLESKFGMDIRQLLKVLEEFGLLS